MISKVSSKRGICRNLVICPDIIKIIMITRGFPHAINEIGFHSVDQSSSGNNFIYIPVMSVGIIFKKAVVLRSPVGSFRI